MSDKQWDGDKVPDGLAQALGERSLSNPAVVGDLVGGFVQRVGELAGKCWDEEMTGPELDAAIKDLCLKLSRVFSGLDSRWTVTSWNTAQLGGLQSKARAMLASTKANYGADDNFDPEHPVAGLFYLLARQTLSAFKAAKRGEDDHTLPETVRFVIALLLGHPEAPK